MGTSHVATPDTALLASRERGKKLGQWELYIINNLPTTIVGRERGKKLGQWEQNK